MIRYKSNGIVTYFCSTTDEDNNITVSEVTTADKGHKRVCVKYHNSTTSYGLTTDTTASEYSPKLNMYGSDFYFGKLNSLTTSSYQSNNMNKYFTDANGDIYCVVSGKVTNLRNNTVTYQELAASSYLNDEIFFDCFSVSYYDETVAFQTSSSIYGSTYSNTYFSLLSNLSNVLVRDNGAPAVVFSNLIYTLYNYNNTLTGGNGYTSNYLSSASGVFCTNINYIGSDSYYSSKYSINKYIYYLRSDSYFTPTTYKRTVKITDMRDGIPDLYNYHSSTVYEFLPFYNVARAYSDNIWQINPFKYYSYSNYRICLSDIDDIISYESEFSKSIASHQGYGAYYDYTFSHIFTFHKKKYIQTKRIESQTIKTSEKYTTYHSALYVRSLNYCSVYGSNSITGTFMKNHQQSYCHYTSEKSITCLNATVNYEVTVNSTSCFFTISCKNSNTVSTSSNSSTNSTEYSSYKEYNDMYYLPELSVTTITKSRLEELHLYDFQQRTNVNHLSVVKTTGGESVVYSSSYYYDSDNNYITTSYIYEYCKTTIFDLNSTFTIAPNGSFIKSTKTTVVYNAARETYYYNIFKNEYEHPDDITSNSIATTFTSSISFYTETYRANGNSYASTSYTVYQTRGIIESTSKFSISIDTLNSRTSTTKCLKSTADYRYYLWPVAKSTWLSYITVSMLPNINV